MGLSLKVIKDIDIEIIAQDDTITIIGNIDLQEPGKLLSAFFNEIHKEIIKERIKFINLDIRKLHFLNSSSIKELVEWIIKDDMLPQEDRYIINFIINPKLLWQERSISTLIAINPDIIKKEIK